MTEAPQPPGAQADGKDTYLDPLASLLERLQADDGRFLLSVALTRTERDAQPKPTFGSKGHQRWLAEREYYALCSLLTRTLARSAVGGRTPIEPSPGAQPIARYDEIEVQYAMHTYSELQRRPDGDWCRWEDVQAQIERLTHQVAAQREEIEAARAAAIDIGREVERLRHAGPPVRMHEGATPLACIADKLDTAEDLTDCERGCAADALRQMAEPSGREGGE